MNRPPTTHVGSLGFVVGGGVRRRRDETVRIREAAAVYSADTA